MNLKEERKRLQLTQMDMAERVGVALLTYQLWERGIQTPNPENMEKLKEVLNVK